MNGSSSTEMAPTLSPRRSNINEKCVSFDIENDSDEGLKYPHMDYIDNKAALASSKNPVVVADILKTLFFYTCLVYIQYIETDVEKLQQRDYSNLKDASLLRFLVDMRGVDVDDRQLRDDLMTMLIAGHETTAAVLTWAVFLLAQYPDKMKKAQAEIDAVVSQGPITLESLKKLEYVRLIISESLRLYPQPPLLIRRSLKPDVLPGGYNGDKDGHKIPPGTDIFISVYNLHRSPYFWDNPNEFEPERFLVQKDNNGIEGWAGFDPSRSLGALYPNEVVSDFAFLPFGGGPRRCVGDQFALMESTIALAMLLQKFDVELKGSPDSVELVTGATIHTKNGLFCKLKKRSNIH